MASTYDVAIQKLDVTFAIDRAGLVGEDGPTHAGAYDLSYLRCIPNMLIAAPSDENETRLLLTTAYQHCGPSAVRYPRGQGLGVDISHELMPVAVGKSNLIKSGHQIAFLNFGTLLHVDYSRTTTLKMIQKLPPWTAISCLRNNYAYLMFTGWWSARD